MLPDGESQSSNVGNHLKRGPVLLLLMMMTILMVAGCERSSTPGSEVLARVDKAKITRDQFSERFQDLRVRVGIPDNGETRKQTLNTMVDEQILLLEASSQGLDTRPEARKHLSDLKTKLLLDQYASRYIEPTVRVSEEELKTLFVRFNTQVEARHLWAQTFAQAQNYRSRLLAGESFEEMAKEAFSDPKLRASGGRLQPFTVDEMEPAFEEAAYSLDIGEISDPVRLKRGYSVLQVLGRNSQPLLTEQRYAEKRADLQAFLRLKKLPEAYRAHADSIRTQVLELQFEPELFALMSDAFDRHAGGEGPLLPTVQAELDEEMKDRVAVRGRGIQLTLGTTLDLLEEATPRELEWACSGEELESIAAGLLIRNHMLAVARRERFHRTDEYRHDVQREFENYLLNRMRSEVIANASIPEDSLLQFYSRNTTLFSQSPKVHLLGIQVNSRAKAAGVRRLLESGQDFAVVARSHSEHPLTAERGGDLGQFSRSELRGEVSRVWELAAGEWIGPVEMDGGGYGFFKVADRSDAYLPEFDRIQSSVEEQYRTVRADELLAEHVTEERKERRILVDEERLFQSMSGDRGMP